MPVAHLNLALRTTNNGTPCGGKTPKPGMFYPIQSNIKYNTSLTDSIVLYVKQSYKRNLYLEKMNVMLCLLVVCVHQRLVNEVHFPSIVINVMYYNFLLLENVYIHGLYGCIRYKIWGQGKARRIRTGPEYLIKILL